VKDLTKHFLRQGFLSRARLGWPVDGVPFRLPGGETLGLVGERLKQDHGGRTILRAYGPPAARWCFACRTAKRGPGRRPRRNSAPSAGTPNDFSGPYSSLNPRMTVRDIAEPLVAGAWRGSG
jgi:ABC-type microcin C transport system duplicated ATPase subunit YejF